MEYQLNTFNDFLKVPADRIEQCLEEFKEAVLVAHAANELAKAAGDSKGAELTHLVWKDDGKEALTLNVEIRKETEGSKT